MPKKSLVPPGDIPPKRRAPRPARLVRLPQVPRSAFPPGAGRGPGVAAAEKRRVDFASGFDEGESEFGEDDGLEQSDSHVSGSESPGPMSGVPGSIEDQHLFKLVHSVLDMPPGFGSVFDSTSADWNVQSAEEHLQDVHRRVQEKKPWRGQLDDSVLTRRQGGGLDRGCHIILPDNRVRTTEDTLSSRVRAQLLDEDPVAAEAAAKARAQVRRPLPSQRKAPGRRGASSAKASGRPDGGVAAGAGGDGTGGVGFPYSSQPFRHGVPDDDAKDDIETKRPLTQAQREGLQICIEYRQYCKKEGLRLPHVLQ